MHIYFIYNVLLIHSTIVVYSNIFLIWYISVINKKYIFKIVNIIQKKLKNVFIPTYILVRENSYCAHAQYLKSTAKADTKVFFFLKRNKLYTN